VSLLLLCAWPIPAAAQTFTTLVGFDGENGAAPWYMSLAQGADGAFYGTTQYGGNIGPCRPQGCGTIFRIASDGTFASRHLAPNTSDYRPLAGLVLGKNRNFYGTTAGTVFEIMRDGRINTLHNFCAEANCADGTDAQGTLIQGADGSFYGTTLGGGILT